MNTRSIISNKSKAFLQKFCIKVNEISQISLKDADNKSIDLEIIEDIVKPARKFKRSVHKKFKKIIKKVNPFKRKHTQQQRSNGLVNKNQSVNYSNSNQLQRHKIKKSSNRQF